jgi:crotonobetainyl-CoA:carnitine CoA-transferase CaiB-like acyl-CoA transferase
VPDRPRRELTAPLTGIRVLDLSRVMAGPWCTQILADLGAEVIKIERPGRGDDTREWGPPWLKDTEGTETRESAYYLSANRGKRSVTVDITSDAGREIIRDLAKQSDILVENFKVGDLAGKGLSYADLGALNPSLIYVSITGFGQDGPRAAEPGYDYLAQAMGGFMSITGVANGEPGEGPQRAGLAVADLTTGMYAVIGILAALRHRDVTGRGQRLDMALLDTQVGWLANQAQNYFTSGQVPTRTGSWHPNLAPYQPFKTTDGYVILAVGNDLQFDRLCAFIGRVELIKDPRFATNPVRVANRAALADEIERETLKRPSEDWLRDLPKAGVPCGAVNTIDKVFEEPQVLARGMKITLDHPRAGSIPLVANPIKFSESTIEYVLPPPLLGEHTEEVLRRLLGFDTDQIATLRAKKAI